MLDFTFLNDIVIYYYDQQNFFMKKFLTQNIAAILSLLTVFAIAATFFIYKDSTNKNAEKEEGAKQIEVAVSPESDTEASVSIDSDSLPEKIDEVQHRQGEKETLLANLKSAGDREDYATFADYLKQIYEKGLYKDKDFESAESAAYVKATDKYYKTGDYEKSLEIATIVYDQVPAGWRFRYLRIVSLEKLGRAAFSQNDFARAEQYANIILQMMYRPEGANLLADIYIAKIESNIAAGDKTAAQNNLKYIWDYEVSQDRRDKLNQLSSQIQSLPQLTVLQLATKSALI